MSESRPPQELVVDAAPAPGDASDGSGTAMGPIAVTVGAAGLLAKFVSPAAGLAAIGASAVYFIARRKPGEGRFVLRVEGGELSVLRERSAKEKARLALADLADVTLDRRTHASGRGGATERVRLALEGRAAEPVHVPEEHLSPLEAQEWLGKVRVFLRKHGWVPESERGDA